jgi:hypothetical protein
MKNKVLVLIEAELIASDIGHKDNRYYGITKYRSRHQDQRYFQDFNRFYHLEGKALEISLRELESQGLKGSVADLCDQGLHNGSTVLDFGKTFILEIEEYNGKPSVSSVRPVRANTSKSSVSKDEALKVLGSISPKLLGGNDEEV